MTEDTLIATRILDGQYPDYKRIIPTESELSVEFSPVELLEAVKDADSLNANFDFWIDGGTNESETMVYYVEKMFDKLKNKLGDIHVMEYIQNGANHGETAWATRIHAPLIQFFGQETDPDKKQQLIKKLMIYEEWANL